MLVGSLMPVHKELPARLLSRRVSAKATERAMSRIKETEKKENPRAGSARGDWLTQVAKPELQ